MEQCFFLLTHLDSLTILHISESHDVRNNQRYILSDQDAFIH